MRRIARIALAAALAVAAAQAVRWLLDRDDRSSRELPPPTSVPSSAGSSNGASGTARPSAGGEPTREELYREARRLEIEGRSKMNKQELKQAVEAAKTGGSL
jgi:hypothetical protein